MSRTELLALIEKRTGSRPASLVLHVGCGKNILPGAINLDIADLDGVDVVHDLDVFPYPFADNTFDMIVAEAILEHVTNLVRTLEELQRITRHKGILRASGPYWNSLTVWADPTHKRGFTYDTFTYFQPSSYREYYGKVRLNIIRQTVRPTPVGRFLPSFIRSKLSLFISNLIESLTVEAQFLKERPR